MRFLSYFLFLLFFEDFVCIFPSDMGFFPFSELDWFQMGFSDMEISDFDLCPD